MKNLKEVYVWKEDHKELVTEEWWAELFADFNDDTEEILVYIEDLCDFCIQETPGCSCEQHHSDYTNPIRNWVVAE